MATPRNPGHIKLRKKPGRFNQTGARKFISVFAAETRWALHVRNVGMRALGVRTVAKLVSARSFRDDFELPDYRM